MRKSLAFMFMAIVFFAQAQAPARADFADNEEWWRDKQKEVVKTVRFLTRVGTRYPAYRCGIYVPGQGVCYMKISQSNMPLNPTTAKGAEADPFVADVAEVIEFSKRIGKADILEPDEYINIQSRFVNITYLRIVTQELAAKIGAVSKKNLLAFDKMMQSIITYIDGKQGGEKFDLWISDGTEKFSKGLITVRHLRGEGMIIPHKAIVLYEKMPGVMRRGGEDALADKLFKIISESKILAAYYKEYQLAVAVESDGQLLFATYPMETTAKLKRDDLKYFRFNDYKPVPTPTPEDG